ncbi:hypothetical protein MRX96_010045 [Rhipicephalus microplus]
MDGKNCVVIPDNFTGYSTDLFCIPKHYKDDVECVFLPCGLVQDRIERMAQDIVLHYHDKPFRALCVLKGGYRFFADMLDRVRHYYHFNQCSTPFSTDFIRVKSYVNDKSSGEVTVMGLDSMEALKGQNILIVEDIIETGKTMAALVEYLKAFEPKEVKVSSLFTVALNYPDKFVVGYALDYNDHFRDLSHVCIISSEGKKKYAEARS